MLDFNDFEDVPAAKVQPSQKPKPIPATKEKPRYGTTASMEAPTANLTAASSKTVAGKKAADLPVSRAKPTVQVPANVSGKADNMLANSNLDMSPVGYDEEETGNTEPENLPDVYVADQLAAKSAGGNEVAASVVMEWNTVAQLPAAFLRGIRQLGGAIFSEYSKTPLDDIKVMATLTASKEDVARVLQGLSTRGKEIANVAYDFEQSIPGYKVDDARIYRYNGNEFLAMQDFGGTYIYSWPETESKLPDTASAQGAKYLPKQERARFFTRYNKMRESLVICFLR